MKCSKIFLKFTFFASYALTQESIGEWNAFTSPLNVRDVIYEDIIYAATEGGLLIIEDHKQKVLTTIDGLEGVDISSIEMDHESNLWLGGSYPYGFIQIFNPFSINSVTIECCNFASKTAPKNWTKLLCLKSTMASNSAIKSSIEPDAFAAFLSKRLMATLVLLYVPRYIVPYAPLPIVLIIFNCSFSIFHAFECAARNFLRRK